MGGMVKRSAAMFLRRAFVPWSPQSQSKFSEMVLFIRLANDAAWCVFRNSKASAVARVLANKPDGTYTTCFTTQTTVCIGSNIREFD